MIQFLLSLVILFAPLANGTVRMWAFGPIYILITIIFIVGIFKIFSQKGPRIKKTSIDIPLLLFLIISIISALFSKYIYDSVMEIVRLLGLGFIFFIVVNFIKERGMIRQILDVSLAGATGISLFGIFQYIGIIDKPWWDKAEFLSATYVNHNHFAGLIEMTLLVSLGMMIYEKDIGKKVLYGYSFIVQSVAFLLSMSRGGWISLTIAMIFMGFIIFRNPKYRIVSLPIITLAIIAVLLALRTTDLNIFLRRVASYKELDFAGRLEIWKGTIGIIKNNWLFGTGIGSFVYNFPKYRPIGLNVFVNYAHNDYLQVASEMGIMGLLLMLYIIVSIIKKAINIHTLSRSSFEKWLSLSLGGAILGLSAHNLGDFNFYIPANAIIFTVFSGLIFTISLDDGKDCKAFYRITDTYLHRALKSFALFTGIIFFMVTGIAFAGEICSICSDKEIGRGNLVRGERLAILATRLCSINHRYRYKLAGIYAIRSMTERDAACFLKKAEEGYTDAVRLNPLDAWSWLGLADVRAKLLEHYPADRDISKLAEDAYTMALRLDPLNSYYLKKFAGFLLNEKNTDLSSSMYKKASYIMSRAKTPLPFSTQIIEADSYRDIADKAFSANNIDKALVYYKMAEAFSDKGNVIESYRLGQIRCYIKMSLLREGLKVFRYSRLPFRDRAVLFSGMAEYYLRRGCPHTAKRFAEKAIDVNPRNPEGYNIRYKIWKMTQKRPLKREISEILDFNNIPISVHFGEDDFQIKVVMDKVLYKDGIADIEIILPAGIYELGVEAYGRKAGGGWPHMIVIFNGEEILETYAAYPDPRIYNGVIVVDFPINRFEIIYDNDYYNAVIGKDRNLYIKGITLKALY